MVSKSRRDSVGGGGVAEFSRGLQKSTRFSGGGGSSRIFPWSPVVAVVAFPWPPNSVNGALLHF